MFGSSLVFCSNLSLIWNCRCSESGFRSGVSLVRICLLCTFVFGPNLSVAFIWFSVRPGLWSEFVFPRLCRWSKSGFHSGFVFGLNLVSGPNLSLVLIFLWSQFLFSPSFYGPNLSLVRICRRTKCDFRSGFVFGLTLVCDPILCLFRIWFSVRSFVWSEFVFCALLFLVRTCRWSLSGFRYEFVFAPILSLVRIWFSLRNCVWSESGFLSEFVFGKNLSLFRIWFSVRICLSSESGFGPSLSWVLIFLWSQFLFSPSFFGPNLSLVRICRRTKRDFRSGFVFGLTLVCDPILSLFRIWFSVRSFVWSEFVFCALLFLVRTCRWSSSGFRYEFVCVPILSLVQIWFLLRICVWFESGFLYEFVFDMKLPLFRIWFSVRSFFGQNLSFVHFCFWSELVGGLYLVFGTTGSLIWICLSPIMSLVQIWFSLRIFVWFESVFLFEFVFGTKLPLFRIWFPGRSFLRSEFFFCALLFVVWTCR